MSPTLRSLSVRNYRLFAAGQLVSLMGTWMQLTAQDWLVLQLGGGGLALGGVLALQFLPVLLFGLYAGVLADRYDKRRVLLATQTSAGLVALTLAILTATGVVTLPLVYVLAGLLGVVQAFDTPTRQAFIVEMVGRDDLPNAVALNSVTFNSARIAGPALAGVLIGVVGSAAVFGANAASYLAVLAALLAMHREELRPARPVLRARGQLREGLRYVVSRRELLLPIVLVGFVGALGLNFPVTLALAARYEFGGSAATYGTLVATLALGSLIGAVLAARRARPTMRLLVGAAFAFGLLEATTGVMPTLGSFAVLLVPTGAAILTFTTAANASVQMAAGEQMRGRVMALYILVFLGTTPLGAPLIGWLSGSFGPRVGLIVGGLGSAVAAAVIAWLLRRASRPQISTQPPDASDSAAASRARHATRRSRAVAASGSASGVATRCTAPRAALARASGPSGAPVGCSATGTGSTPRSS